MRADFLELACCPTCHSTLQVTDATVQDDEIWAGQLVCVQSGHSFAVINGIPQLHRDDESWHSKAREAAGWVQMHKEAGIYQPGAQPVDLQIPYFPEEPWFGVAAAFDLALAHLNLRGDEVVLDLGAGRGWAAKQFALHGCRVVALDIVSDEYVGLGRARDLMRDAKTHFELVIGDGEHLPFFDGSFDLVFCSAALHHSSDLSQFVQSIGRVLKSGGRLCAIYEPCISIWQDATHLLRHRAAAELDHGINETMPTWPAYWQALRAACFQVVEAFPRNFYATNVDWDDVACDVGATAGWQWTQPLASARGLGRFLARRLLAWRRGVDLRVSSSRSHKPAKSQEQILLWCGGELFLIAEKQ